MSFLGWPRNASVSPRQASGGGRGEGWGGEAFTFYFIIEMHFETFK